MESGSTGQRIRALRLRAGLTQQAVASALGLSLSSIQNIESGRTDTRASTIAALVSVLGCSADAILGTTPDEHADAKPKTTAQSTADENALFVGRWFFSLSKPARRAAVCAAMGVKRPDLADILERAMRESSRSDGEGGSGSRGRRRAAGGKG